MKLEEALKTNKFTNEVHKASINLLYTSYWLKSNLNGSIKEHGITPEQYNVMRILKGSHPNALCVKDIAERMIEQASNVPRIIQRMLVKKLVVKKTSGEDKRETLVSLTDKGIELLEKATLSVNTTTASRLNITEEEALQLNLLLEKLRH